MTISVVNGHARRAMMTQGNTLQVMCCGYVCEAMLGPLGVLDCSLAMNVYAPRNSSLELMVGDVDIASLIDQIEEDPSRDCAVDVWVVHAPPKRSVVPTRWYVSAQAGKAIGGEPQQLKVECAFAMDSKNSTFILLYPCLATSMLLITIHVPGTLSMVICIHFAMCES